MNSRGTMRGYAHWGAHGSIRTSRVVFLYTFITTSLFRRQLQSTEENGAGKIKYLATVLRPRRQCVGP